MGADARGLPPPLTRSPPRLIFAFGLPSPGPQEYSAVTFDADSAQLRGIVDEGGSIAPPDSTLTRRIPRALEFADLAVDVAHLVIVRGLRDGREVARASVNPAAVAFPATWLGTGWFGTSGPVPQVRFVATGGPASHEVRRQRQPPRTRKTVATVTDVLTDDVSPMS